MSRGQLRVRVVGDVEDVQKSMDKALGYVKVGAAALAGVFAAGLSKAMDAEAASDKMAAQLGLTAKEHQRLGGVAGKLYANAYGENIEAVNTAVASVVGSIKGMRGASAGDVEAMTATYLDLASVFELDVARAAQVAGQMIETGFAKDGARAADLLTVALQRVPAAVREDLLDAIDEYGPFMQTIGITGERAMALLVRASQKGMYGIDKTGDAIKEATIRMTDMSAASKVGFDAIGMSQQKMAGEILKGGDAAAEAFELIVQGVLKIKDPVKQSQAALALFGTPLEDLSVTEIPKFLGSLVNLDEGMKGTEGAAKRMGQTFNDNAKTNLTAFYRTAEMAVVNFLGTKVLPILTSVARFLTENFGPAVTTVVDILRNIFGPALSWLTDVIGENQGAVKVLAGIVVGAGVAYMGYRTAVMAVTTATRIWTAVTKGMRAAQLLLNLAMRMSPIGRVVTLVAGLTAGIVYLWNKSAKFRGFFIGVWNAIKAAVRAVGSAISQVIGIIKNAVQWVKDLIRNVSAAASMISGGGFGGKGGLGSLIPGLASGGPAQANQLYVVGEKGPELFIPNQSGMVLSNADLGVLMAQAERDSAHTLMRSTGTAIASAPSSSSGGTTFVTNVYNFPGYIGSKADITKALRAGVKTEGRGSAQRYFGG